MNERDLSDLLGEHATLHLVPGASIGVLRDGVETFASYGVADTTTGTPVTPASCFSVGSLTKSMVATVVMRLANDDLLSLDDPVAAHVPELRGAAWAERARVLDLLANRSGLPLRMKLEFDFSTRDDEGDDVLARFATRVSAEEPTPLPWSYTNAGWCVLGRAIETVTRSPWEEAMRRHLLVPTRMRETAFAATSEVSARVSGHEHTPAGPVPVEPLVSRAFGPAGASLVSTVGDLLRFAALHLDDSSLGMLRDPQPSPRLQGWFDGWCLGWAWFDWDGGPVWGWDSVVNGERAFLRLEPERRAAVVLLCNGDAGRALYRSLLPDLMRSLFDIGVPSLEVDAQPGAAGDPGRLAGFYAWPDRRIEVTAAEAGLLIKSEDGDAKALPVDEVTFVVDSSDPDDPTVTFWSFDAAGRPGVLYDQLWGLPRLDDVPGAQTVNH